jgi:SAM-dependent MidA family methyltransferase
MNSMNAALSHQIPDRLIHYIQSQPDRRISFAQFMDWALYDPESGYYSRGAAIGKRGDFLTASHYGPWFAELLAKQAAELWQTLGKPDSFDWVEMGAGQGRFAADFLHYCQEHEPDFFEELQYKIIERSAGLITQQRETLDRMSQIIDLDLRSKTTWLTWDEIPDQSLIGCCFSNELIDAFAVHLVESRSGQWQEVHLSLDPAWGTAEWVEPAQVQPIQSQPNEQPPQPTELDRYQSMGWSIGGFAPELDDPTPAPHPQPAPPLQEKLTPLSPDLADHLATLPLTQIDAYPEGYRTEINLAARTWLTTVATKLQRGYVLTIDYGYDAQRYYQPSRRQGTLQCYSQHRVHNDPYLQIGKQDLTAHVDFTAIETWGQTLDLDRQGRIPQGPFLMNLGLGDRLTALAAGSADQLQQLLQQRDALHQLINPLGLGRFEVLLQIKGLTATEALQPLTGWQQLPLVKNLEKTLDKLL